MSGSPDKGQSAPPGAAEFQSPSTPTRTFRRRPFLGALASTTTLAAVGSTLRNAAAQQGEAPPLANADVPLAVPASVDIDIAAARTFSPDLALMFAGGEYIANPGFFGDRLFNAGGPTVLLSPYSRATIGDELEAQGIDRNNPNIVVNYAVGRFGDLLSKIPPNAGSMVVVDGNRAISFEGSRVMEYYYDQPPKEVEYTTTNPFYKPQTRWSDDMGLVGTDGYRITHQRGSDGQWQELKEYVPLGENKQRTSKFLKDNQATLGVKNDEIAIYEKTGIADKSNKTFEVVANKAILVKGGPGGSPYGLSTENIDVFRKGLEILDQVGLLDYNVIQCGTPAVAGDTPPLDFDTRDYASTFNREIGIVKNNNQKGARSLGRAMAIELGEPRGRLDETHYENGVFAASYRLADDQGLDKIRWSLNKIKEKGAQLIQLMGQTNYQEMKDFLQFNSDQYAKLGIS